MGPPMHQTLDRSGLAAAGGASRAVHCRVRDLTKRFGNFTALKSVSLDVLQGELVCFLGPSGCGKTTLLRAIAGLDLQSEGAIEIAGRDVSNLPPAERDFGIVFQSYALFPNLSIVDNVGYGLVNRSWPRAKRRERVAELLALVGLSDQGAKYPIQLSGGQQQRVALARALATSPSLLLLDEPLSALDARVRVRLRDEIKALQRRLGITTIMVTHDQEEALAMADRIVVMNQGVIEQVGTPAEVYGHPRTAFVADFVGTMTFLDGLLVGDKRVRIGNIELVSALDSGLPVGSAIQLGFRPEEVQVRAITETTPNTLTTTVETLEYLGAFCRAMLKPAGAPDVVLTADFSANAMRDLGIVEGQPLVIALPPQTLRIFPAKTGAVS
jgi:iron(III) transport system ATP-binding protein